MKPLCMSGYVSDIIQVKGLLQDGMEFISMPGHFDPSVLRAFAKVAPLFEEVVDQHQ